jgi:Polyketide cyclase / dehydrase and lipid transport
MPTTLVSISIAAPPEAVLELIADPRNLPRWAPAAPRVGRIAVSREAGTVDFPPSFFTRVVPRGDGSELVFTALGAVDEATLRGELENVRALCEAG